MTRAFLKLFLAILMIIGSISTPLEAVTIARQHAHAGCRTHIASAEAKHGIPPKLLEAIATVESGISPWVINYHNKGHYFHSKEAAAAEIRRLQKMGIRSINIGCMQLHAPSHQGQFKSIEDMLEPANNISYAASYFKKLHRRYGTLEQAVKYYHSASPVHNTPYQAKIYRVWNKLQGKPSQTSGMTPSKFAPRGASAIKPVTFQKESNSSK